jgi:hypothetical protein
LTPELARNPQTKNPARNTEPTAAIHLISSSKCQFKSDAGETGKQSSPRSQNWRDKTLTALLYLTGYCHNFSDIRS